MRSTFLTALCLCIFLLSACSGEVTPQLPDTPPAAIDTQRRVATGDVIGFADGENTFAWLGIPYAQAPIGDLRWRAPRPPKPWQGVRQALSFGEFCPQLGGIASGVDESLYGQVVGAEDCLFINIWAPRTILDKNTEPLPVMLWIHGGGNTVGTANTYQPFARKLAGRQQVIVATINYRLGVFGWFAHPALVEANGPQRDELKAADNSGNYGTLDSIQALRWVRENIAAFGGDPERVTIFGESAGGYNVYSLMVSPLSEGLFQGAISQSGGLRTTSLASARNGRDDPSPGHRASSMEVSIALALADGHGVERDEAKEWLADQTPESLTQWLRAKSPEEIFPHLPFLTGGNMGLLDLPQLIQDGYVLPAEEPSHVLGDPSQFHRVPLITGTNRDEMKMFMSADPEYVKTWFGLIPQILDLDDYQRMAHYNSQLWRILGGDWPAQSLSGEARGAPVYTYRFDFDQLRDNWLVSLSTLLGAGHALEVGFVFGMESSGSELFDIYGDDTLEQRQQLAHAMSSYWANFAYTGAPGRGRQGDLPLWRPWSAAENGGKLLVIDADNRGGIRQIADSLTLADLKKSIASDPSFGGNQQARCQTYARVFYTGLLGDGIFDQQEYDSLGGAGCRQYPLR